MDSDVDETGAGELIRCVVGGRARLGGVAAALRARGLGALARLGPAELTGTCGLAPGAAGRLAAAFELGRAVERARAGARPRLTRPGAVAALLAPEMRGLEVETFHALLLDARHRLKGRVLVGRGTLTSAPVHPREVFGPALRAAAAGVIVAHNHPSGDPRPSEADHQVTERLVRAGAVLGVPLLDHVIWAEGSWVSLREDGRWPAAHGAHPAAVAGGPAASTRAGAEGGEAVT